MSIPVERRSQVTLHIGGELSASDRAALTAQLLERGLEVACRRENAAHTAGSEDPALHSVPELPRSDVGRGLKSEDALHPGTAAPDGAPGLNVGRGLQAPPMPVQPPPATWKPWFPVIDYARCTNCMQCLSFCLFDVYGVSADRKIQVQNQSNCKTDCPACSRVCPEVAIMFPKYRHGPINGDEVQADDVRREAMKVDISALLGGDVYAMLRDRSAKAKSRFSKERDDDRALKERQNCLVALKRDLEIPPEVLAALPSPDEIMAKAEAARQRAEAAKQPAPGERKA